MFRQRNYLHEWTTRNKETHQLILAEKSVQGKVNVAVSAYVVELEQFNDHLYGVSPSFCWVESMSCPFCVNCQLFDSAFRFQLPLGLESLKLYYNTYSHTSSGVVLQEWIFPEIDRKTVQGTSWKTGQLCLLGYWNCYRNSEVHCSWTAPLKYSCHCWISWLKGLEYWTSLSVWLLLPPTSLNEGIVEVRWVCLESHLKCIRKIAR